MGKFHNFANSYHTNYIITSIIACSAKHRYLIYSDADFEGFFRPAGATGCTYGGKIWQEGDDQRSPPSRQISFGPLLPAKFYPIGATTRI